MSATRNEDAVNAVSNNQEEQFGSRVPPSEPLARHGRKPGVIPEGSNAAVPEFTAETYTPGTAPKQDTYRPAPNDEVPPLTNYAKRNIDPDSTTTSASDTIGGATTADLHTGLGHPGQGQTSTELRHEGAHGRKKETAGLEAVGAGGKDTRLPGDRVPGMSTQRGTGIDASQPGMESQRALDRDDAQIGEATSVAGSRGNTDGLAAEERIPESAETIAAERSDRGV